MHGPGYAVMYRTVYNDHSCMVIMANFAAINSMSDSET